MSDPDDRPTLLFVYNVDASPVALLRDAWQGITTGTTDCHLCDLTFGRVLKDRSWRSFVEGLPVDVEFKLRSTFRTEHPDRAGDDFPAAYWRHGDGRLEPAIAASAMEGVADLTELRALVGDVVGRIDS